MSEMNTKEVLLKAAETLETCGWGQGVYHRLSTNCFCVVGACRQAARQLTGNQDIGAGDIEKGPVGKMLAKALGVSDVSDVIYWNDADGRLKSEVVNLLHSAAELA